jgi:hypothetical protein
MSGAKSKRDAARRQARPAQSGYQVGYRRPPTHTRFKPGQSGNPKGRPKGAKNEASILREILEHQIPLQEGGRIRKISIRKAILLKMADGALKGDTRKAAFVLDRYSRAEGDTSDATEADPRDQELLDSFYKRVAAELEAKRDKK